MKRMALLFAAILLVFATNIAQTEVLSWNRSEMYDNNSPVPPEKIPFVKYNIYSGDSINGPWNPIAQLGDNSLYLSSTMLPNPGGTRYYTGEALLDGGTSGKGVPYKYTKPSTPPGTTPGCDVKPS